MGERKRRGGAATTVRPELLIDLSRQLTDEGRLVEAGWVGFRIAAVPQDAPKIQVDEMRNAFMAGAQHLFASIMTILDPGEEPTESDLARLGHIEAELVAFGVELLAKLPTAGSA